MSKPKISAPPINQVLLRHHLSSLDFRANREVPVKPKSRNKKLQIMESVSIAAYWSSEEEVLASIRQATEGLEDWNINLETHSDYDGERAELTCTGWRDATPEEAEYIQARQQKMQEERERIQRVQDENLIAELRERRPELFPTTFVEP